VLAVAAIGLSVGDSHACGVFVRKATVRVPSLHVEEVLVIHDADEQREHFIRRVTFRDAAEPFGFVIPTPSRPEVAKVNGDPFSRLSTRFLPYRPPLGALGAVSGAGAGPAKAAVQVLSTKRVGSFDAFVIAANDAAAMTRWLDEKKLGTTSSTQAWLARYVRLGFHFVALRYAPPQNAGRATTRAETIRISFSTAVPYYPYVEPAGAPVASPRSLVVWVVSDRKLVPVALASQRTPARWKRPWASRQSGQLERDDLRDVLGPELFDLVSKRPRHFVEVFEDQKTRRDGWGDVLLVPSAPITMTESQRTVLEPMMALLDPELQKP
jgi:hypothetical protein